ncbi:MAG: sigma-70 family RNA polymerase sigma factor [Cytophagales bacterium]|nr:sigma-70 family RNA polymerase sigma factor [Cytophagales bacterium]
MLFFQSNTLKKLSDLELVEEYKTTADNKYVSELLGRYTTFTIGICMKYLKNEEKSKDATMQIFEKLLQDLMKHSISNFRPWLHQVIRNFCLMELRKEKSEQKKANLFVESEPIVHPFEDDNEEEKESHLQQLSYCIKELKKEQKECIELFFLQEKCYQEIAEITEFTLKKVKSYIQNGKRNLKICMEKLNG